ncbi:MULTISPECIES: hypothetical protein [unclassified Ensifer]|uniref:hypothetical protein n=1 Tax=unclassified Ensifer TaxID=2633371 RepID=UPI00111204D0|nr:MULTISPECIES: hypothetical protein [unclassified Ensifer]
MHVVPATGAVEQLVPIPNAANSAPFSGNRRSKAMAKYFTMPPVGRRRPLSAGAPRIRADPRRLSDNDLVFSNYIGCFALEPDGLRQGLCERVSGGLDLSSVGNRTFSKN